MPKGSLQTNLIGQIIRPDTDLFKFYRGTDGKIIQCSGPAGQVLWRLQPNFSNQYYGTIRAAWVENGQLKVLILGPTGDMQEGWLTHYKLVREGDKVPEVDPETVKPI